MPATPQTPPLRESLQKSCLKLFEIVLKIELSCEEIKNQRRALDKGENLCVAWVPAPKGAWETRLECLVI
jgi:hypothetical protein